MEADWPMVGRGLGKTDGGLNVRYNRRDGNKYKCDSFLRGRIGKSQWLTKCKGLEGEGGVRDSTEVSALGNSMGDDKLFSEMGNTEVWRWNMVQFGPC